VGGLADLSVTSFHPVKPITSAEGGAVLGDREELIARVRRFRDHGIERNVTEAQRLEGPWYHGMEELGFNYRLSDVHSALGLSQLQRLDWCVARRREIAGRYADALADLSALRLPRERDGVESGWHLYVVRVADPSRRRLFFERLRQLGLGVQVHYLPVYLHPYYQSLGYRRGACPVAEDFYSRCVSIPLYPGMSEADVKLTIEGIRCAAAEIL
jgi:dTDP-4-amino-4,6-dideoxygalactose transaminase